MREEKPRQGDLTFSGGGKLKPARGSERPGGMTDVEAPGGRNPAGPMTAGGLGGSGRSEPSRPRGGRWFFFSKWWKPSDQRIWRRKLPADLTSRHRKRWGTRARGKLGPGRRRCLWLWTLGRGGLGGRLACESGVQGGLAGGTETWNLLGCKWPSKPRPRMESRGAESRFRD